jgi:hypothetical protein
LKYSKIRNFKTSFAQLSRTITISVKPSYALKQRAHRSALRAQIDSLQYLLGVTSPQRASRQTDHSRSLVTLSKPARTGLLA